MSELDNINLQRELLKTLSENTLINKKILETLVDIKYKLETLKSIVKSKGQ